MHGPARQLFILLCLFGLVLANIEPYSTTPRKSKSLNEPDVVSTYKKFKDNAPTLVKIFQVISEIILVFVWILDGFLSSLLWILNEIVRSSTDFTYKIFGALFNIVKLLEALGFGIKFLLEINFNLVSYLFDTANALKEYFQHAVTLVKISLANETEHVYESGSMVLEGVHNLFVTTCWSRIIVIWDKIHALVSAFIDNFDGFPKPNLPMIVSSTVAATTFFLESVVITAGVIWDGVLFLFSYIGEVICELHNSLLAYIFLILTMLSHSIAVIIQYIILLVTLPFHVLTSIIYNTLHLLHSFWQVFTKQCFWLGKTVGDIIQHVFRTLLDFTMMMFSETLRIVSLYIPGGVCGLVVIIIAVSLVYIWRKDIVLWLVWLYNMNISSDVHDDNAREVIDEEIIPGPNYEGPQNLEASNISDESETEEDPNKLVYELEKEKDKRLCVICQDKVKNILLLPCRHVCLCQRCYQEIKHSRRRLVHCPLCRQHVQSVMEVFV